MISPVLFVELGGRRGNGFSCKTLLTKVTALRVCNPRDSCSGCLVILHSHRLVEMCLQEGDCCCCEYASISITSYLCCVPLARVQFFTSVPVFIYLFRCCLLPVYGYAVPWFCNTEESKIPGKVGTRIHPKLQGPASRF